MQYFRRNRKYNFIDKNNVFVGYDAEPNCCESFGWTIRDSDKDINQETDLCSEADRSQYADYCFDTKYFKEIKLRIGCEDCNIALFRMINDSGDERFLVLSNHHNGYYGHGFEMNVGDTKYPLYEGCL